MSRSSWSTVLIREVNDVGTAEGRGSKGGSDGRVTT